MPEIMDIIKGRHSIRKFEEKEVPEEIVNQLMEAVQWSPSWGNTQCWEVVIVRDQGLKEQLVETLSARNPSTKTVANAPVVFALAGKKKSSGFYNEKALTSLGDWMLFDLGLATQSLCLAAHGLGLGSVIVGAFDVDRAGEILGVPEGYAMVALVPVGFPAKPGVAVKRRQVSEFTHQDRF